MKRRVAASQIDPWLYYTVQDGVVRWVYAHPVFWERHGLKWDVILDRNRCDRGGWVDDARGLFWDFVFPVLAPRDVSGLVRDILATSKSAEKSRLEELSTQSALF